jgi:hypothetical protein
MAATDIITYDDCKVEIFHTGTFNDVSGWTASVTVEGRNREVAEAGVFGVTAKRTAVGKISAARVTIRFAYTEGATDPFTKIRAAYLAKTPMQIRFYPAGAGKTAWTSDATKTFVLSCPPPQGDADSGEIVFCEATFYTPTLTRT